MANSLTWPVPGEAPELSENAVNVLHARYLLKNEHGNVIETPAELFTRVASLIARAEAKFGANTRQLRQWHETYYDLMASLRFLPNSPTLMNAQRRGTLSACFVLPIEDSIEGIFDSIKQTALIQQAGGGTGFSFDKLRPTGDRVASSGGTTSGPISFWRVFSETTNAIQQGAFRRGANMGMMSVEHPDIVKFLHAKQNLEAFTNFNISVKVSHDWMKKVLKAGKAPHVVENPRTHQKYLVPKKMNMADYTIGDLHRLSDDEPPGEGADKFFTVKDIWTMIVKCAHRTGEPGIVFIDRINRDNPTPSLGPIEATNPCGEQPLLPYEACTLGSINLTKFVRSGETEASMDWPALGETVKLGVRFLDNVIEVGNYPVRDTVQLTRGNRKIGLGVMGFADCLFMLGIPYDSQQGVDFGAEVMKFVNENARKASAELANLRGPFPNWNSSIWRTQRNKKVRNAAITCIAPTGTISIIADCSASIEPAYSLVFRRQILDGSNMLQVNPIFKQIAEKEGFYSETLIEHIAKSGSIQKMTDIPEDVRRIFKCAYDIGPRWHIHMQAAFQNNCDAAVSKTINFREKVTTSAVDKAFKQAYHLGCKGVTVYRRRSRDLEPMALY